MRHLYLIRIPVGRTLQVVDGSAKHRQEARNKKKTVMLGQGGTQGT